MSARSGDSADRRCDWNDPGSAVHTARKSALCCAAPGKVPQFKTARPAIPSVLKIVALVVFASTLFTRAVDPLIPKIAADLAIDLKTAALSVDRLHVALCAGAAGAGLVGDHFGKTRLMNLCLLMVALAALVCAAATSFSLLVAMRIAGRAGRRRIVPGRARDHRRSGAGRSAPGRDRPAAGGRADRQSAGRLDLRRDRRHARLARRVRGVRPVRAGR